MYRFDNDYHCGAHPLNLEALREHNDEGYDGYGLDLWCEKASEEIRKHLDLPSAAIHFVEGATQANFTIIASALRPWQSVLSPTTGHIHAHETGAVEHTGHKIELLPTEDGKITASQVREVVEGYRDSEVQEHITQPKMVYISFPTEMGSLYTKAELEELHQVCRSYGLYLFADGARMGYGLGADTCDVTLKDLSRLTDVFTIGGTKCGALLGEAVVVGNPQIQTGFRASMKQNGALMAKGWLLGLQFHTLFKDGLYFEINRKACEYAMRIRKAFEDEGVAPYIDSHTNQQFVVLSRRQLEYLEKNYVLQHWEKIDEDYTLVRVCTSWSTTPEEVDALVSNIERI